MKYSYQYRLYPDTAQKLTLNQWLRTARYWYNRMLGERIRWWDENRCHIERCSIEICHLPELKVKPNYYNQKLQLPRLKEDLIQVKRSGELLDFSAMYSTILQDVCKRVERAFERYIKGDKNGKRSGKPRFKNEAQYRTMVFDAANNEWLKFCTISGHWLFLKLPKIGLVKVRTHRPISDGANVKQVIVTRKVDGWYASFILQNDAVSEVNPDEIIPTWDNSIGLDAVLHEDGYIATSTGELLLSLKPLRKNLDKLAKTANKRDVRKKGSKRRRKLAKREARQHQRLARSRKDFQYKTAHKLVRTGKKVFFREALNLKGLSQRNAPKQDASGQYLPNGQAAKSRLNKSWMDAAFGQFFLILQNIASKAGGRTIEQDPAYTSQLLSYRDEFIFTDCSIRRYWDDVENLWVDRDINAAINVKRVGLGVFPTIKRRRGKTAVIVASMTHSTSKEVLTALRSIRSPRSVV